MVECLSIEDRDEAVMVIEGEGVGLVEAAGRMNGVSILGRLLALSSSAQRYRDYAGREAHIDKRPRRAG
jgi:hypothetical protein